MKEFAVTLTILDFISVPENYTDDDIDRAVSDLCNEFGFDRDIVNDVEVEIV